MQMIPVFCDNACECHRRKPSRRPVDNWNFLPNHVVEEAIMKLEIKSSSS